MTLTDDLELNEVANAASRNRLAVLFGAGVSKESFANLPGGLSELQGWVGLLSLLVQRAENAPDVTHEDLRLAAEDIEKAKRRETVNLLETASILREATSEEWLRDQIRTLLQAADRAGAQPSRIHRALARLTGTSFFTTNYDDYFERAWQDRTGQSMRAVLPTDLEALAQFSLGSLCKLHGDIARPESLVLTVQDYNRVGHEVSPAWKKLLESHLQSSGQLLLIGYSYGDPDIQAVIDELRGAYQGNLPGPFWLTKADRRTRLRARALGLRLISLPDWNAVVPWLDRLHAEIERRMRQELPPVFTTRLDAYRHDIDERGQHELRQAFIQISDAQFAEAESLLRGMLPQMHRLAQADPGMYPLLVRCQLGLAACLLCQQDLDQARPLFLTIAKSIEADPGVLSSADRGLLGQGLAQIGEVLAANKILPENDTSGAVSVARQLIAFYSGAPLEEPFADPFIEMLWCGRLVQEGQLADAAQRAVRAITASTSDIFTLGHAVGILIAALHRSVLDVPARPIAIDHREEVIEAIETALGRLWSLRNRTPKQMWSDFLRLAVRYYHLSRDPTRVRALEEELKGEGVPLDLPLEEKAARLAGEGRFEEAEAALPQEAPLWLKKLELLELRGYKEPGRVLTEALALAAAYPDKVPILYRTAYFLLGHGRVEEALVYAERAVRGLPCWGYRFCLAQCLLKSEQAQDAWSELDRMDALRGMGPALPDSAAADPTELAVLQTRAIAAGKAAPDKEPELWRRYLLCQPDDAPAAQLQLAGVLQRLGRPVEEVAREAWSAIEADRIDPQLTPDQIFYASQLLRNEDQPAEATKAKLREIADCLRTRYPGNMNAEAYRFQILAALGQTDQADLLTLEGLGVAHRLPLDVYVEHLHQRSKIRSEAARLYRAGEISFEAFCELTDEDAAIYLSRLFRFHKDGTITAFLCPPAPFFIEARPPSPPDLTGRTLLAGHLELLLLHRLGILTKLGEAVARGRGGKLYIFEDVYETIEQAARRLVDRTQPEELSRLDELQRTLERLVEAGKLILQREPPGEIQDEELASSRKEAVIHEMPPPTGAKWLAPQTLISYLVERGDIDQGQAQRLRLSFPLDSVPLPSVLPTRCYLTWASLYTFHRHEALSALINALPGEVILGPHTSRLLFIRREELLGTREAAKLARQLRDVVSNGRGAKWLDTVPRPRNIPGLAKQRSGLESETTTAIRRALELALSYRQALLDHPDWQLINAEFAVTAPWAGQVMRSYIASLEWPAPPDQHFLAFAARVGVQAKLTDREISIPLVCIALSANDQRNRDELVALGFGDALRATDLVELARRYGGLDRPKPARILDVIEWRARAPGHPARLGVQQRLNELYGSAIWEVFCGDVGLVQHGENVVRVLLQRAEDIDGQTAVGVLDAVLHTLVMRCLHQPNASFVPTNDGKRLVTSDDAPAGNLWRFLDGWAGADRRRRTAGGHAIRMGWVAIDDLIKENRLSFDNWDQVIVPLLLAARLFRPKQASAEVWLKEGLSSGPAILPDAPADRSAARIPFSAQLMVPELESLAILSAMWPEEKRPLAREGAELSHPKTGSAVRISYEEILSRAVGILRNDDGNQRIAEYDGLWFYGIPLSDGALLPAWLPPEAVLLRANEAVVRDGSIQLAIQQGIHDGRAYDLLMALAQRPDDAVLRRTYARAMAMAPFRQVREDPTRLLSWVGTAWRGDFFPATLSDLRAMLSEPGEPLPTVQAVPNFMSKILYDRVESGAWKNRMDVRDLGSQACLVPGSLPMLSMNWRLDEEQYPSEVGQALQRLELMSTEFPAALVCSDLFFLRRATVHQPLVQLAEGTVDLRQRLPSLLGGLLKTATGKPAAGTLAEVEGALLRQCAFVVQGLAQAQGKAVPLRDGIWLTYRLCQWLCVQLRSLPADARRASLQSLRDLAPAALAEEQCTPDLLDPFRFNGEGFEHRLASILYALAKMEGQTYRSTKDTPDTPEGAARGVSSPDLENELVSLIRRPLSVSDQLRRERFGRASLHNEDVASFLGWVGPVTIPELALVALLWLQPAAFMQLSTDERMAWLQRLPPTPDPNAALDRDIVVRLLMVIAAHAGKLQPVERVLLKDRAQGILDWDLTQAQPKSFPAIEAACYNLFIQLYREGERDVLPRIRRVFSDRLDEEIAVVLFGPYLVAVSYVDVESLAAETEQVLSMAKAPIPLAQALFQVVLAGSKRGRRIGENLLRRLAELDPYKDDVGMRQQLSRFGLAGRIP